MSSIELPWTGERLVTSLGGDIVLEHLHRYALAVDLVAGKDVLDIGCGEGYGGDLLAAHARSVTGVDISLETVRHAQSKYGRSNLKFLEGSCLAIPMPDRVVDVVVSFETLEHFAEQEQFLAEVRRVLRPGGILVVSTPDKTIYTGKLGNRNQFHPRELEAAEFEQLLRERFAHVQILSQRVGLGSFLAPTAKGEMIEIGTHRGNFEATQFTPGVAEGVYLIGVASDAPLPPLKAGMFEFGREESTGFMTPLVTERASAEATRRSLAEQISQLEQAVGDLERSLADRDSQIANLGQTLTARNQTIDYLNESIAYLNQVVESASRWQQRSWFTRAFHHWRQPWAEHEQVGFLKRLERSIRKRRKRFLSRILGSPSPIRDVPADSQQRKREEHASQGEAAFFAPATAVPGPTGRRRIVFVSGEADTPGHTYRVEMAAEALARGSYEARILRPNELSSQLKQIERADALVIWRATWSKPIAAAVATARQGGGKVVFDVDDLMFDPALARTEVIDGIRSQKFKESAIADFYREMQQTMMEADCCTCTTQPLATAMRRFQKTTFVLPNGFDDLRYRASRKAAADKRRQAGDGLIRIGYAGGSRTHQRDFGRAAPAVARTLRENPQCRLVLFRLEWASKTLPCLDVHEFADLAGLDGQIEWRRMVPVKDLPREIARFDINLAPLETGNVFCEAKSEIKYFEAALVDVPTVASPTAPYAEAICDGRTGFLAGNSGEWYDALKRLVEDPDLRRHVGRTAFLDVLWRFGPERRAELAGAVFEQILNCESAAAARWFELELRRAAAPRRSLPECAEFDVVFEAASLANSEAAVVVPLYNYAVHVVEALESVKKQTLAGKELIVVEDCSTDDSLRVAEAWMRRNAASFTRVALVKNLSNAGLARTRNAGFGFADAAFVLPLDADNVLLPNCLETCLETITKTGAAAAYATIREFGDGNGVRSEGPWAPGRFVGGNYIDAMALVRRSAWAAIGGYQQMNVMGWEDYELWCRFVEEGFLGVWIPETLSRYRVHARSMLQTHTDVNGNRRRLSEEMRKLHPWVEALYEPRKTSQAEERTLPPGHG